MLINFEAVGSLREHFGSEVVSVEMNNEEKIADILIIIKEKWGEVIPAFMWDTTKNDFRGPIIILVNGTVQMNRAFVLHQGDFIQLRKVMVGG